MKSDIVNLVSLAAGIHFLSETKTSGVRYFRNVVGAALNLSLLDYGVTP